MYFVLTQLISHFPYYFARPEDSPFIGETFPKPCASCGRRSTARAQDPFTHLMGGIVPYQARSHALDIGFRQ